MEFGLRYANTGRYVDLGAATELLQVAEEAGFESAWTVEHTIVPGNHTSRYPYSEDGRMAGGIADIPLPDPLIWMACLAGVTSTIRLGTAILILPQHNPVITAKQVATLDAMSGGRVLLGVGVGWLREEFEALGADFAARGPVTDEYIQALRVLWEQDAPTFNGKYVSFEQAYCRPQPANGTVPIIIGGHSKAAARRAGRLGDGFFPARALDPTLVEQVREAALDAGRDPGDIEITASLPDSLDDLPALVQLGVSRVMVPVTPVTGMATSIRGPEDLLKWRDVISRYSQV